jgi:hypothetical protein
LQLFSITRTGEDFCSPTTLYRPLPAWLSSEVSGAAVNVVSGIWPEINTAYFIADNKLLLWNYESSDGDEAYKKIALGSAVTITAVGLVVPRADVFTAAVKVCILHKAAGKTHKYMCHDYIPVDCSTSCAWQPTQPYIYTRSPSMATQ